MIYTDIETYIHVITGQYNIARVNLGSADPPITIPESELTILRDISTRLINSCDALSDLQGKLVERLLTKYKDKLAAIGIELPGCHTYARGVRTINRSRSLTIIEHQQGELMSLHFPYDTGAIEQIKAMRATAAGRVFWDHDTKTWLMGISESNVSWAVAFAQMHGLVIDPTIQGMFDAITEVEKTPYAIELRVVGDEFVIQNGPTSMTDYIDTHYDKDNFYALVDAAGTLGFTIEASIAEALLLAQGPFFAALCMSQSYSIQNTSIEDVLNWAKVVGRYPIMVYNPTMLHIKPSHYTQYFEDDEVLVIKNSEKGPVNIDPKIKLIYTVSTTQISLETIPLLISHVNLLYGSAKRALLQSADKVVYNCVSLPRQSNK